MGNQVGLQTCAAAEDGNGDIVLVSCTSEDSVPCGAFTGGMSEVVRVDSARPRKNSKRFPHGSQVMLNVYHLDDSWLQSNNISKQLFGIGGAFHAGIEVHGVEWTYGYEGISCNAPRSHQVHVYHESILLGETPLSANQIHALIENRLDKKWQGEDYHMLEKNCCNFSDSLSLELVGDNIPGWVTRFPHIASQAAAYIDVQNFLEDMRMDTDESPTKSPGRRQAKLH